ncbi:hypothetical protein Tcan_15789 [Toxocara canis]|uniref:G_PROTEIN_RECEP_F1_2 domain-containing protein n=1 Tax=Toxocara canis TaxID=6265 RepID=A0A0B2V7V4_TOXCA|nr:hypothetical protein Tcan_15789 [Toxocara canis]
MYAIIGIINLILILVPIVPYVLILKILYRDKDSRGGSYKIMFHLGIADCIQLICFTPSWLCHLMDEASFPFALNKFFGALLNAGWVNYVHFTLLLSINRLVILFFGQRAEIFFNEMGLTVTLIALWLSACVLAAAYLTPVLNVIYEPENLAWNYSGENPYVTVADKISIILSLIEIALTFAIYVVIVCLLCYHGRTFANSTTRHRHVYWNRGRDLIILLQAALISGFATFNIVYWQVYNNLFPNSLWANYGSSLTWIVNCGVNPAIYLTINRPIRRKIFAAFRPQRLSSG